MNRRAHPRLSLGIALTALALSLVGCQDGLDPAARTGSQDDTLRMNHLQAEGTHNSYHIQSWFPLPQYQYTNAPLDEQADSQGVRKFEPDVHYNGVRDRVDIYHAVVIDRRSTCETLTECVGVLKRWSDANPDHHPIFILLEPKYVQATISQEGFLDLIESDILDALPRERIITPDEVQGAYATLPRALAATGWPTLAQSRGRFMFILHDTEELQSIYTHGGQDLYDRLMFVESSPGQPFAGFVIMNDPEASFSAIQSAVQGGYLVRTRSDSSLEVDAERFQAALNSGAHIISTDFPDASNTSEPGYWIEIPGGNPSRCNPLVAPAGCTAAAIEDL